MGAPHEAGDDPLDAVDDDQFHSHAEFHAQFVTDVVLLSRTLDAGLAGGILLLWGLSLPIAHRAGRRLHERSRTDELTGLPNRTALEERLGQATARLARDDTSLAVLFIDLDGFKTINDTLGHTPGDRVLGRIASRLRSCTRPADTVARFAGDEFVVVLEDSHEGQAEQAAQRVLEGMARPLDGLGDLGLSASIGIVTTRDASLETDVFLRQADAVMYHVKSGGGNGYRIFDHTLRSQVVRRNQLEGQLPGAAARGELNLLIQPFVPLADPSHPVVAVEALLRWTHPQLGPVGPGELIPLAERSGTIERVGDWALFEACRHLVASQADLTTSPDFVVYVNLSVLQLTDRLLHVVDHCLAATGADPHRLGFEITETAVLATRDAEVIALLDRLRRPGCRVALDDFGAGYSSLSRLRATPLDLLELDGSFISTRSADGREQHILTAVAGLARRAQPQPKPSSSPPSESMSSWDPSSDGSEVEVSPSVPSSPCSQATRRRSMATTAPTGRGARIEDLATGLGSGSRPTAARGTASNCGRQPWAGEPCDLDDLKAVVPCPSSASVSE